MFIKLIINGTQFDIDVSPSETLFKTLRMLGFHGVKFGDEQGLTGSDTVLLDGRPVNAGSMLAAQAEGHNIATIEALGEHPDQGWKKTGGLHPLQLAFIATGAIQCGYCTPAQILAAKALLDKNPNPTESEVRQAIAGVLCRCTGYAKPVQAILKAAAVIRGEAELDLPAVTDQKIPLTDNSVLPDNQSPAALSPQTLTLAMPKMVLTPETTPYQVVGKPEPKIDAIKLAQGISNCAACCTPKCRTRRTPMPASPASMPAVRAPCLAWLPFLPGVIFRAWFIPLPGSPIQFLVRWTLFHWTTKSVS